MRPVLIFLLAIALPFIEPAEWILKKIVPKRIARGTKDGLFDVLVLATFMGLITFGAVIWAILFLF